MEDEQGRQVRPRRRLGKILVPILAVLFLLSAGAVVYLYREIQTLKNNPQAIAQEEVADLIAKVGELIVLPDDETPTVATVAEREKLQDQAFFARAKNGDKVLIYTNTKKAILYDPIAHKIIEVAPINIGEDDKSADANTPAQQNTQPTPEVAGQAIENTPPTTPSTTPPTP
jgi:hypothetical protein